MNNKATKISLQKSFSSVTIITLLGCSLLPRKKNSLKKCKNDGTTGTKGTGSHLVSSNSPQVDIYVMSTRKISLFLNIYFIAPRQRLGSAYAEEGNHDQAQHEPGRADGACQVQGI